VVPVVIFLRRATGVTQRLCLSGDHDTYLDFRYLSCALGDLFYEHYRHSDNLVVRLNLPNMQYPAQHKVAVYAQAVRELIELKMILRSSSSIWISSTSTRRLTIMSGREYQRAYPDEAQIMSRFAERFREEGIQQGLHQGEALVWERQLRLKFGALPDEVQRRIEQASEQTLLTWSEQILTANRLDEVLH